MTRTGPPLVVVASLVLVWNVAGTAWAVEAPTSEEARATFAGGSFWCMEESFERLPGVLSVTVGYTGGWKASPTYSEVSSGHSGHVESVEILYDPTKANYERLLHVFWHNIDPLMPNGQFCDHRRQYRSVIFFHSEDQRRAAEESRRRIAEELHATVVTEITPASVFYPAEKDQQDFYRKNPNEYREYRMSCGRDNRLRQLWGDRAGGGAVDP
jgi:peptide-methionine (S)-S-oxide reductase